MSAPIPLDVSIMGREYRIVCPAGQESALRAAVNLVEQKMKETAKRSRSNMPERVAVLAAVNIASDYLEKDAAAAGIHGENAASPSAIPETFDSERIRSRIESMDARLAAFLAAQ
ncbi:MAG: cell division protein ZapA [Zoogloeaceae bacterium]|jgi:cell division protein ZapA|nr:cell division protein ZapA [Zoogloeaceae bacterium]